jgi:hypothetical protein
MRATSQKGIMALHSTTTRRSWAMRPLLLGWLSLIFGVSLLLVADPSFAGSWLPSPAAPRLRVALAHASASPSRGGPQVDPQNRTEAINFYNSHYLFPAALQAEWTGDAASCTPGTTSERFRAAVLRRINYFRAMAGIPADITFSDDYNRKAQAAALMMSVNRALDHFPNQDWNCYSSEGDDAADNANLHLIASPLAIDDYMRDPGDINSMVPHRRWLLYPQTQQMGTGDIPENGGNPAANVLWVVDEPHFSDERPATRDGYVAWPPPGYVPEHLIFERWSLSYAGADFGDATVTMTLNGQAVPLNATSDHSGYGEPTIVWEPDLAAVASVLAASTADAGFAVTIANVRVDGQVQEFGYEITTYEPVEFPLDDLNHHLYAPMVVK